LVGSQSWSVPPPAARGHHRGLDFGLYLEPGALGKSSHVEGTPVKPHVLLVATVVFVAACSSPAVETAAITTTEAVPATVAGVATTPPNETTCESKRDRVAADEVTVGHELTGDERRLVDWALGRFAEGGLSLPERIEFVFDPTGEECHGHRGTCHPSNGIAKAKVCLPMPEEAHKRAIVLLHELAHLWDWVQGDGLGWPDRSEIVGGSLDGDNGDWDDRSIERVAHVITWGLYDGAVHPYTLGLSDREMCDRYEALTGSPPPEPVRSLCRAEASG
jgi:hypothetical protein